MAKKTLSEAAAEILNQSRASAPGQPQQKLESDPGYDASVTGGKGEEDLGGDTPDHVEEDNPDATRPIGKAKEPGARPPIGKENDARTRSLKGNNYTEDDLQDEGPNKVKYKTTGDGNPAARGGTPDAELDHQEDEFCEENYIPLYVDGEGNILDEEGNILSEEDLEGLELVEAIEDDENDDDNLYTVDGENEDEVIEEGEEQSVILFDREALYESFRQELEADLGNLLDDDKTLSEEFKGKAKTIFEAAVMARVDQMADTLEAAFVETLEEAIDEIKAELTEQTNDYLSYVAEEWMKDNELAIEKGLKSELTEDFINGLKKLFVEHYIDIPEDKVNVVEELADEVAAVEDKLNEQIARNVELTKAIKGYQASEVFATVCEGLTDVQVDKMQTLAEGLEFTSEGEFKEKLEMLRDNYFTTGSGEANKNDKTKKETKNDGGLNESVAVVIDDETGSGKLKNVSGDYAVDAFASALARTSQNVSK